jgi:hypothetical protein
LKPNLLCFIRDPKNLLPYLTYLTEKGNTTVFEWRTSIVPKSIEKPVFEYRFERDNKIQTNSNDNDEINFDIDNVVLDEVF